MKQKFQPLLLLRTRTREGFFYFLLKYPLFVSKLGKTTKKLNCHDKSNFFGKGSRGEALTISLLQRRKRQSRVKIAKGDLRGGKRRMRRERFVFVKFLKMGSCFTSSVSRQVESIFSIVKDAFKMASQESVIIDPSLVLLGRFCLFAYAQPAKLRLRPPASS